jgi:predicted nucleotidyltransferase component of viral defense system
MKRARRPTNVAASVRARLHNLARERHAEFQLVLSEFAIERFLYRLACSPHVERFVLKGAMLFKLWFEESRRATWDLDLLGRGASSVTDVVAAARDVCSIPAEDGIVFNPATVTGEEIRAIDEYAGVRLRLEAGLADARIPLQVDVGFGDAVIPAPSREKYPTLLDHAHPMIMVYPREAVVAEKLEAMVSLGVTNSRMKDFYDVHLLASSFAFDGARLVAAVRATFAGRGTPFPGAAPLSLTREFLGAPARETQWRAFLRRGRLEGPRDAGELSDALRAFLGPVLDAAAKDGPFDAIWPPGGPWQLQGFKTTG